MAKSFNARMADRFKAITTNGDKLNLYVHETAMMIVRHAAPESLGGHNDCSMAQKLVMAMPASMRREMLILWFARYTPIVVKNDEKWSAQMLKEGRDKKYIPFDLDGADAEPFYKIAEDNREQKPALTAAKALEMLLGYAKRINKQIEDGKVDDNDVDYLRAISTTVAGLKIARPSPANDTTPRKAKGLSVPGKVEAIVNGEAAAA